MPKFLREKVIEVVDGVEYDVIRDGDMELKVIKSDPASPPEYKILAGSVDKDSAANETMTQTDRDKLLVAIAMKLGLL